MKRLLGGLLLVLVVFGLCPVAEAPQLTKIPYYRLDDKVIIDAEIDTEAELEGLVNDVLDIFTNNDGALTDDDLSNNILNDIGDVNVPSPSDNDAVIWDAAIGKWVPEAIIAGDMFKSTYDIDDDGDIDVAAGGTEKSSWTQYCIPYLSTTTSFGEIGIGTANYLLKTNAATNGYDWQDPANWNTAYDWGDHSVQNYFDKDIDVFTNISDVTISTPSVGQLLKYSGSVWENWTPTYLISESQSLHDVCVFGDSTTHAPTFDSNGDGTTTIGGALTVNGTVTLGASANLIATSYTNTSGNIWSLAANPASSSTATILRISAEGANWDNNSSVLDLQSGALGCKLLRGYDGSGLNFWVDKNGAAMFAGNVSFKNSVELTTTGDGNFAIVPDGTGKILMHNLYYLPTTDGTATYLVKTDGFGNWGYVDPATVGGGISGPVASTDEAIARWDGAGGDTLQDSGIIIDDSDNLSGVGTIDSGAITSTSAIKGTSFIMEGGTYDTTIQPGTPTASVAYTWPLDDGSDKQRIETDGSGTLSWAWPALRIKSVTVNWDDSGGDPFVNNDIALDGGDVVIYAWCQITTIWNGAGASIDVGDGADADGYIPTAIINEGVAAWYGLYDSRQGVYLYDPALFRAVKPITNTPYTVSITVIPGGFPEQGQAIIYIVFADTIGTGTGTEEYATP